MKDYYRITVWGDPKEIVETQYGNIEFQRWLSLEAKRIGGKCKVGIPIGRELTIKNAPQPHYVALFRPNDDVRFV